MIKADKQTGISDSEVAFAIVSVKTNSFSYLDQKEGSWLVHEDGQTPVFLLADNNIQYYNHATFSPRPPRRKRVSRSLSSSRRYKDNPPPYTPRYPSPDPDPPIYQDGLEESVVSQVQAKLNKYKSEFQDDNKAEDIIENYADDTLNKEEVDKLSITSNKPRNPPIISEIEEELKPGNRSKKVRKTFYILKLQGLLVQS